MIDHIQIITRCDVCGYGFRAKTRDGSLLEVRPKSYCAICPECGDITQIKKFTMISTDAETYDLVGTTIWNRNLYILQKSNKI